MARSYSCEITSKRLVALDGHFQCPACGFASPMRVWGEAQASRTIHSRIGMWENARPITEIPAPIKAEAKREAEMKAWDSARQRTAIVKCPRCLPNSVAPWAQFAVR